MKRLLVLVLLAALGCGGHRDRDPDGSGTIDPCPPYCR